MGAVWVRMRGALWRWGLGRNPPRPYGGGRMGQLVRGLARHAESGALVQHSCNACATLVRGNQERTPVFEQGTPPAVSPPNFHPSCTPKTCGCSGGYDAPKGTARMLSPRCYPGDPVLSLYSNGDATKGKGTGMGTLVRAQRARASSSPHRKLIHS